MSLHMSIVHGGHDIKSLNTQIDDLLAKHSFSDKFTKSIKLVLEEIILQNLVPYSEVYYSIYPITVDANYISKEGLFTIAFIYSGMQFDPVEGYKDLSAAIVKKTANYVQYRYVDGVNYLKVQLIQK